jgi:hypothetical protein
MDTTDWGWNIEKIAEMLKGPKPPKQKYIITDDKEEFLNRLEARAKFVLKNVPVDNLKYLEELDRVKAVRAGADIFETFPILKEWNERPEC